MLKFFYKTFLISLLSGSLLLLDFSYQGSMIKINSVQAETLKTGAVKDDNMMATLTMIVVGLLASRLWKAKMTPDIMLAAAGGGIFIAGDIIAVFKNQKDIKALETEIVRNEEGKIDQKQIEVLEKLKKSYKVSKDTATMKKNLQMAAAAAFAAAGATAFLMAANEAAAAATCLLGINGATAAASTVQTTCMGFTSAAAAAHASAAACTVPGCSTPFEATAAKQELLAKDCNKELAACSAKMGVDLGLVQGYLSTREIPSVSLPACTADTAKGNIIISSQAAIAKTCTKYTLPMASLELSGQCAPMAVLGNAENSCIATIPLPTSVHNDVERILYPNKKFQLENSKTALVSSSFLENAFSLFIPSARAALLDPLGIGAGIAIEFVFWMFPQLATMLDLNLLIPKRRAIAWGILSALSLASSVATGSEIGKIEENIKKIDTLLNSMYALKDGVATANIATGNAINSNINPTLNKGIALNDANIQKIDSNGGSNQTIDLGIKDGPGSLPCITGDDIKNCPSFSEKLNSLGSVNSMPEFLQSQIGNIGKLTDGINGKTKITGSTLDQAQVLASQQNALKNELLKQQNSLQEKIKASGSKTDLANESDKLEASIKAIVQKGLELKKTTASAMYASFGGNFSGGNSANATATDAFQNTRAAENKKGSWGEDTGSTSVSNVSDSKIEKSTGFEESDVANSKGANVASMDNYDLKNDITKDKEKSIFDLISNRYQKSYEKLFKRVK